MKRSELYAKVWAAPVRALAQEVGLSDTRVATICKKHGVPLPTRGHWAKLAAGKIVESTPLPQPEIDYEIMVGGRRSKSRAAAWVVPGVLQRAEPIDGAAREAGRPGTPPPAVEHRWENDTPATLPQRQDRDGRLSPGELELVQAAADEYERIRRIEALLAAAMSQALSASTEDAAAIRAWAESVRIALTPTDPVARLLNVCVAPKRQ